MGDLGETRGISPARQKLNKTFDDLLDAEERIMLLEQALRGLVEALDICRELHSLGKHEAEQAFVDAYTATDGYRAAKEALGE
jgi:hypothetical protein